MSSPGSADVEPPAEHEVPDDLALAGEFDPATREQWRELVAGVLRKAGREDLPDPVEEALRRTVATGVQAAPLYTAEDAGDLPTAVGVSGLPPFVRGARAGAGADTLGPASWDVRQRQKVKTDLVGGEGHETLVGAQKANNIAVSNHRAFRRAGGSARVDDDRRVTGL